MHKGSARLRRERRIAEHRHWKGDTHTRSYNRRLKVEGCRRQSGCCDRLLFVCINDQSPSSGHVLSRKAQVFRAEIALLKMSFP